jgi:hypothetical protein
MYDTNNALNAEKLKIFMNELLTNPSNAGTFDCLLKYDILKDITNLQLPLEMKIWAIQMQWMHNVSISINFIDNNEMYANVVHEIFNLLLEQLRTKFSIKTLNLFSPTIKTGLFLNCSTYIGAKLQDMILDTLVGVLLLFKIGYPVSTEDSTFDLKTLGLQIKGIDCVKEEEIINNDIKEKKIIINNGVSLLISLIQEYISCKSNNLFPIDHVFDAFICNYKMTFAKNNLYNLIDLCHWIFIDNKCKLKSNYMNVSFVDVKQVKKSASDDILIYVIMMIQ